MEFLNEIVARWPELLAGGEVLPALLLIGAGTSIFLIADNGAQGFNALNAVFIFLGYATGAILTAIGVYMVYLALLPLAGTAVPAV